MPDEPADDAPRTRPPRALSAVFWRLLLIAVLPLVLLAGGLATLHLAKLRADQVATADRIARNFMATVDAEVGYRMNALATLGASTSFQQDDLTAFYREAMAFREAFGGQVLVTDADLNLLLSTRLPLGAPLGRLPQPKGRAAAPTALESGQPAVGDRVTGVGGELLVAFVRPARIAGDRQRLLLNVLPIAQLQQRLDQVVLPAGMRLTLRDSIGLVLADSHGGNGAEAHYVHQRASPSSATPWRIELGIDPALFARPLVELGSLLTLAIVAFGLLASVVVRRTGHGVGRGIRAVVAPEEQGRIPRIVELAEARQLLVATRRQQQADAEIFRALIVASTQAVWHYQRGAHDATTINTSYDRWWQEFTGQDRSQRVADGGTGWLRVVHPDDRATAGERMGQLLHATEPDRTRFRVRRTDGEWRWLEATSVPLHDADNALVGRAGTVTDVTARVADTEAIRAAHHRLKDLSGRLIDAQETERRAIARDLHDQIGQTLTAIKLNLQSAAPDLMPSDERAESIGLIDLAIQQVRTLSLDLRPPQLDDLGLAAALRWQLDRQCKAAGIAVAVDDALGGLRLPDSVAITAYRIVQEAVLNAVRHAAPTTIGVRLSHTGAHLHLAVTDDGRGFEVGATLRPGGGGVGVSSMLERAELAGGSTEITSTPGAGTRIDVTLPLHASSEASP